MFSVIILRGNFKINFQGVRSFKENMLEINNIDETASLSPNEIGLAYNYIKWCL